MILWWNYSYFSDDLIESDVNIELCFAQIKALKWNFFVLLISRRFEVRENVSHEILHVAINYYD